MFGKKDSEAKPKQEDLGNVPDSAFRQAQAQYAEIFGSPRVEATRWFVVSVFLLAVVAALAAAIFAMAPLKTVRPFLVSMDKTHGVVAQEISIQNFKPEQAMVAYFLGQWIDKIYTLDPYTTKKNLNAAYSILRDKAVNEYLEFVAKDKPLARLQNDPSLTSNVIVNSISPGENDGIQFAVITVQERSGAGSNVREKVYRLTIHYVINPPTSERELRTNPLGLFITHFNRVEVNDQGAQQ